MPSCSKETRPDIAATVGRGDGSAAISGDSKIITELGTKGAGDRAISDINVVATLKLQMDTWPLQQDVSEIGARSVLNELVYYVCRSSRLTDLLSSNFPPRRTTVPSKLPMAPPCCKEKPKRIKIGECISAPRPHDTYTIMETQIDYLLLPCCQRIRSSLHSQSHCCCRWHRQPMTITATRNPSK